MIIAITIMNLCDWEEFENEMATHRDSAEG